MSRTLMPCLVVVCLAACDSGATKKKPVSAAVAIPAGTGWFCYVESPPGGDGICLRPDDRDICEETAADRTAAGKPRGTCEARPKAVCMAFREKMKGNELETWCYPTRTVCDAYRQRYAADPGNYSDFSDCVDAE